MKASQAARLAKGHEGQFLVQRGLAKLNKLIMHFATSP